MKQIIVKMVCTATEKISQAEMKTTLLLNQRKIKKHILLKWQKIINQCVSKKRRQKEVLLQALKRVTWIIVYQGRGRKEKRRGRCNKYQNIRYDQNLNGHNINDCFRKSFIIIKKSKHQSFVHLTTLYHEGISESSNKWSNKGSALHYHVF